MLRFQLLSCHNTKAPPKAIPEYSEFKTNNDFYTEQNNPPLPPWMVQTFFGMLLFGRTPEGLSVCLRVEHQPTMLLQLPEDWRDETYLDKMWRYIFQQKRNFKKYQFEHQLLFFKKTGGFFPDLEAKEPTLAKYPFLEITCPSMFALVQLRKFLTTEEHQIDSRQTYSFQVVEKEIPPILKVLEKNGGKCSGVFEVPMRHLQLSTYQRTIHCDREYVLGSCEFLRAVPDCDDIFPLVLLSFDIEVVSDAGIKVFPSAENLKDLVVCIASTVVNTKTEKVVQVTHTLGQHSSIEGLQHYVYDDETALIESWRDFVIETDPDLLMAYNSSFDWSFLAERMEISNPLSRFFFLSRLIAHRSTLQKKQFSSRAFGDSDNARLDLVGRIDFDLYVYVTRNYKFKSYSLDFVSQQLLKNQQKTGMTIAQMIDAYKSGEPDRIREIVRYCAQDTLLPYLIWKDQLILESLVEMSRVCCVFVQDLLDRGQMYKIICQMYVHARKLGFSITAVDSDKKVETFKGATVLSCESGFYENIMVLDFMSLYPSIMQFLNLCFSSLVTQPKFKNLEGFEYNTVKTDLGEYVFQKTIPSLLPHIIQTLLSERKAAKKLMAKHKGTKLENIFNARQLALKISCNSIYGFTGASQSPYFCPQIASSVTAFGRSLIETTQKTIEEKFPESEVIYGDTDSVMVRFGEEKNMQKLFELSELAVKEVEKVIGTAIVLEVEKCYSPALFFDKKRYAGLCYESPSAKPKLDAKGIITVRRDFCDFQKKAFTKILNTILYEKNIQKAIEVLKQALKDLTTGKIPFNDLVLSRKLAANYKNEKVVQKVVADRIEKRKPGSGPKPGDRVPFVVVQTHSLKSIPLFEQVEAADYAEENKIPLDFGYYVKTFKPCVTQLFSVIPESPVINLIFDSFAGGVYTGLSQSSMSDYCQNLVTVLPKTTKKKQEKKQQQKKRPLPQIQTNCFQVAKIVVTKKNQ